LFAKFFINQSLIPIDTMPHRNYRIQWFTDVIVQKCPCSPSFCSPVEPR
jgi:hypothetical protein